MGQGLDKCVSKFSDGVIKGSAAAGEPSSKPQDWSGQWRLPSNDCCVIGCKAVLMSPQCQSFSKFGSYSKYISLSNTFIKWNFTAIFLICCSSCTHTYVWQKLVLCDRWKFSLWKFSSNHGQSSGYHDGQRCNVRPHPSPFIVYGPPLSKHWWGWWFETS